jgi:hypothetical protein
MKLVMTMMVRDEADIIRATLEHHRAQGIDVIIVTDNGSVDGTTDILEDYAAQGLVDLRFDPRHRKQQSEVVTAMARDAYTMYGADWVINADADEFWVAHDATRTVRDVLEDTPKDFQTFLVPVIDMIGAPALEGSGLNRLQYRDHRTVAELHAIGLLAHSTPDAVHIGTSDIEVAQGNHAVSLASRGAPARSNSLEVLHLPWRSWAQYSQKVEAAGRAYSAPGAPSPSPNHHGMRDFTRLQSGLLEGYYLIRHPDADQLERGLARGTLVRDDRLAELSQFGVPDVPYGEERRTREIGMVATVAGLEGLLFERAEAVDSLTERVHSFEQRVIQLEQALMEAHREINDLKARRVVRMVDRIANTRLELSSKMRVHSRG